MSDAGTTLRKKLEDLGARIAAEEIERAGVPEKDAAVLRKAIIDRVADDLDRDLDKAVKRIREEVRNDLYSYVKKEKKRVEAKAKSEEVVYERFNRNFRFQHILLFTSVLTLIMTGMPMKFSEWGISQAIVDLLGAGEAGVARLRLIHRIAAAELIAFFFYHMIYNIFFKAGRRDFWLMIPRPKDAFDAILMILYFLGITKERPRFDRFSYIEKFDYWAVYWGCVVMIGTGSILWFNEFTAQYIPKWSFDLAKIVHSDEALLATLALVIWHFYNVHFNPDRFPGSLLWWHGKLSEDEMKHEHPLELERIIAEREQSARGSEK